LGTAGVLFDFEGWKAVPLKVKLKVKLLNYFSNQLTSSRKIRIVPLYPVEGKGRHGCRAGKHGALLLKGGWK
jgi:hypothetical protein